MDFIVGSLRPLLLTHSPFSKVEHSPTDVFLHPASADHLTPLIFSVRALDVSCYAFKKLRSTTWVIISHLAKSVHFLEVLMTQSLNRLTKLYVKYIVRLHGVPMTMMSDGDTGLYLSFEQFTRPQRNTFKVQHEMPPAT